MRWRVARCWNNVQSYRQVPRFSDRGRLPGTEARKPGRRQHLGSVTMVDCLVLKLMHPKTAHELGRCISKYRKICLVFLFQRAVSAIFSWKVRSPQAYSRPDGGMGAL